MTSLIDERQRRLVIDALWLGVVGAVAAQLFTRLLHWSQLIFLKGLAGYEPPGLVAEGGTLHEVVGSHGLWLIPVVTTLGGLIAGLLVYSLAPEAEGHGTDSAVKSFHRAGGFIRPIVTPLKMVASAITIGSGGAAGREGPTALIAAGIGSIYATYRKRSDEERRLLVLIGMAAGLSAIFRTPIGAAILVIEVLYYDMEFESPALLYTILASVVAYTCNGLLDGWEPLFDVPANLGVTQGVEYLEYAVLGIAGGAIAALLPMAFYYTRDVFEKLPVIPHVRPAIGGLLLGLMALELPEVLGGGYGWLQMAIDGDLALNVMLVLIFAKILAMSLSVGSGGSGGVFAPSLFVGGMLGGVLAEMFDRSPAAFVIVGMAAVFSGAGRVPIATLFMVVEMTDGYHLLAPAALVVTLSYLVQVTLSVPLKYKSLYEAQIPVRRQRDVDLLEGVKVEEVMTRNFDVVPYTLPLKDLAQEFERTHHHGFPVVNEAGQLYGVVTLGDLERAVLSETESFEEHIVADIASLDGIAVGYPDEPMSMAAWRIAVRGVGRLPIVSREDTKKLVGVITRSDIVNAYEQAMANRKNLSSRLSELRMSHEGKVRVLEVDIPEGHKFAGKTVQEIAPLLPTDCILASIRREARMIIPHGDTMVRVGDHVITLASATCAQETEDQLRNLA